MSASRHWIDAGDPRAPDVAALLEASEAYAHSLYPPESVHMLDVSSLTAPSVRFRVARSADGRAEGCGAVVVENDGSAELKRMFVMPSARGRGVGALILQALEREAREAGARVIRLETGPYQPEALRLYRRFGYRERGPFGAYRQDPLSVFMEKDAMSALVPFAAPRRDLKGSVSAFHGRAVSRVPFTQVAEDVERVREQLRAAGVEPGMLVGFLGENCYEWMIHDLAVTSLGALSVCFPVDEFAGKSPDELARAYDLSLLLVTAKVGHEGGDSWVLVMDTADRAAAVRPATDNGLRRRIRGTDVCTVIFSSGTSGQLKALLLSRAGVDVVVASLADDWAMGAGDGILVALPLSIFQQRVMIYAALRTDTDILLTDAVNLFRAFKALRPTIVLGPPALFETVEKRFDAMSPWRRCALSTLGALLTVVPSGVRTRWRRRLFRDAHEAFGGRIRVLITGSAPSKRSTLALYGRAGLPVYQAYGLAEVGFIAWNRPWQNRVQSVGRPVVPGSVTIADDGEILITVPRPQAIGYFGVDPDEEARTFLPDGRIATGDLGRIDRDGYLHITGRKKNVILMQSGEKIQPEPLETTLSAIPGVERAAVVGGGALTGLVAVLAIDPDGTADDEARVRAAAQAAIDALNARVKSVSRVTRFIVTRVPFRPETGLVTRNLKLDRQAVARYFDKDLRA